MERKPSSKSDPQPLALGRDGEAQFERLRACLEVGRGFELFFCGFETPNVMDEVRRRLATAPPPGNEFEALPPAGPAVLPTLAEHLTALSRNAAGRKIVFASTLGWEEDLKGAWAQALRRLNERRNAIIRDCPNAVVLAGPSWLPWLAHDVAPDLWSVRTAIFTFPGPAPLPGRGTSSQIEQWRSGLPMAHELEAPVYYEELAAALEGSRRPGEQETRGRLLLRASAAWKLGGSYDPALQAATKAAEAFAASDDERMVAVSRGYIADILQQRGETDEALRIRREEELPVYERLGDVRERAVTMGKIADILEQRGETDEALRTWREEVVPVMQRLGDVRNAAVAMGKIANILEQRGETDEALRIHIEERLPVAERMGDVESIAHIRFCCAQIRLQRGGLEKGERQTVVNELAESFALLKRLQRANGVAAVGPLLGQCLAAVGEVDEALAVLDESADAFERLKLLDQAGQVRELQKVIRERAG